MTTALDLITGAGRLIGVVRKGETLAADEAQDALLSLNEMIESWANNGLLVVADTEETFSVTSALSYTIGAGQTLNTARPLNITQAYFTIGNLDYPLIMIDDQQYNDIVLKDIGTSIPQYINYSPEFPYGKIRLYPQASGTLFIASQKALTGFAALSTTVSLPPGWTRALRYNLAIEMAPEFGVATPPEVIAMAKQSKGEIALAIAKTRPIKPLDNRDGWGNIYNGWNL
jgi:hypothetical protein